MSLHKAINWVVSAILVAFAIWSISLNAEGRAQFAQALAIGRSLDDKLSEVRNDVAATKAACEAKVVPITIPVPTETP